MRWSWGSPNTVRIAVSAVDPEGRERTWLEDLRPNNEWTVTLLDGTRVTIVRPVRVRVDLRRH